MSHKKHQFITAEVCVERSPQNKEYEHLLEHVRFLEDRATDLEVKVEILRDMFNMFLEIDPEEGEEDEKQSDFFASIGCNLWDDEEEDDEDEDF